jgi:hypothetical protein
MRAPQIIVLGFDEWIAKQLRAHAAEHRWLLHDVRQANAVKTLIDDLRPTILFVQVDPLADASPGLALLAEVHATRPEIALVVVSDGKLQDEDRARWTASAFDLGASFVLFPPLTGPVLEDLAGGLMLALVPVVPADVIDLAEEGTVPE